MTDFIYMHMCVSVCVYVCVHVCNVFSYGWECITSDIFGKKCRIDQYRLGRQY